jgi:hypothetical protein
MGRLVSARRHYSVGGADEAAWLDAGVSNVRSTSALMSDVSQPTARSPSGYDLG